ncbi:MAG: hypothetical protein M1436_08025, partial [Acidobacteria bacterium]|nr:hypothetical protein [Acidobacteriota bacterium]
QLLRLNFSNGKLAREERREYVVVPEERGVHKELAEFQGKYEHKGKYLPYDHPGYQYKKVDIDGQLIDDLSRDLTGDGGSRDGIAQDQFPLTGEQQSKYDFTLLGAEEYQGRQVWRIGFEPKRTGTWESGAWKGEALIDALEYQPVRVYTTLAYKVPAAVKIVLGTDIRGLGFSVTYRKFDDGVWFPVTYGGEFYFRCLFLYKRTISISLVNSDFRRAEVNSRVKYATDQK